MKTAKDFVKFGYTVRPAVNGGFIVTDESIYPGHQMMPYAASFSNADDLLVYLTAGHNAEASDRQNEQQQAQVQA